MGKRMTEIDRVAGMLRPLKGELFSRYRVRGMEIFGSVCRGEHGAASDLDLLVDFCDDADLLDMIGLEQFLEQVVGRPVDVVPRRALRPEFKEKVLKEAVAV